MKSIRIQLASTLFIGFLALLSGASALIFFISKSILEDDFDSRLFAKAQAALASISQKGDQLDIDWTELPQELNPRKHARDVIQIFDSTGHVQLGNSSLTVLPKWDADRAIYQNVILPKGHFRLLAISFLPRVEEDDLGNTPDSLRKTWVLAIATDRTSLNYSLRKLALILLAMTAITSLLSFWLVRSVLRRGLRPLEDLGDAVVKISPESLGQIIPVDDLPEELAPIAVKLNNLLKRLDVSFARERRFSADISHELRTPVAELKTLSEVMLAEVEHAPEFQQAFQHTLDIAHQMEALVTVLLEMVRHEEGRGVLTLIAVDLESILKTVRQKYEEKASEKEISLADVPEMAALGIQSDPWLLMIIFSNLFDNAVEYSPRGSRVGIDYRSDEKSPFVEITNTAIDLVPSDLPHLFERFWRKDTVRGGSNHFGIGLALTRTLCQRLGVHLTVSMSNGNLVRVLLYLPTKRDPA